MRAPIPGSTLPRAALVLGCVLLWGTGSGCSPDAPGDDGARGAPPEGALDLLNQAIFVRGGTLEAGSDDRAGDLLYGSPFSKADEVRRSWEVESFWIQEHEVTNQEYVRFDPEHEFAAGTERHPVVRVTWREAMAYARSVGGTLPNDVQWEFAARGEEAREYPWGDEPPSCDLTHYAGCEPVGTVPVMTRAGDITPERVYDLAGNVREWVTPVWFDLERHPVNRESRRLKGGSFKHPAFFLRGAALTKDIEDDYRWDNIGFRVVWPLP